MPKFNKNQQKAYDFLLKNSDIDLTYINPITLEAMNN